MRKFIVLLAMCFLAISSTPSFASVGVQVDNEKLGSATNLRFNTSGLAQKNKAMNFDGSTLTFNLLQSGTGTSGATSLGTGDQDVQRGYSITYKDIGSGAETGIIHRGLPGELITIRSTAGGGGTWTLTDSTSTTWNQIIFNAIDQTISLLYISDTVGWIQFGDASAIVVLADPS